jgi:3-(methylthio)propanoyl-CoA dehydrogenase
MSFDADVDTLIEQIGWAPGMRRLRELNPAANMEVEVLGAMITEALRFASEALAPFDTSADRKGSRLEQGRVQLAPGHEEAWSAFCDAGWTGLDIAPQHGGLGLPRILATALQECFDRVSVTFGMLPGAARAAARLLSSHASPAIASDWIPKLANGTWAATICISESDAGSDIGRIRTAAKQDAAGNWSVSGEKMWISYGDHGLTARIGHIVLARPAGAGPGVRGLSLFLVPSEVDSDGAAPVRNSVKVRRVEEKLGLHGSPTCALGFEGSRAYLIGTEGRGVAQLFSMIVAMRLQVGTQGLGFAEASLRAAAAYARERRQGGAWNAPPVPIAVHADVQLTLINIASRIATLRGLVYAGAVAGDLADAEPDPTAREQAAQLQAWLLPIIKNSGAETGFNTAADALLVFGGAGYTIEWPLERYLRDSRVLAIYEGTAGMQAMDLVRRRWREPGTGIEAFVAAVNADLEVLAPALSTPLREGLKALQEATSWLRDSARQDWEIEAAARAALTLATEVAHGWIGVRLASLEVNSPAIEHLAACGRHASSVLRERTNAALLALYESPARRINFRSMHFG